MKHSQHEIFWAPTRKLGGGWLCHKDSPSPPPTPDYGAQAAAQGAANVDTAVANSKLNNPNVINPYGTQTWTDGASPTDRATLTQTLSPEQQSLYDKNVQTKGLLSDLGITGAQSLQGVIGKGLDLSGASAAPGAPGQIRQDVVDAIMGRVNEDTAKQRDQSNSDLIAAGIRPGTKAYDDQQQLINRGYNDARSNAIQAGTSAAAQDYAQTAQSRKDSIAEILAQRQTPLNEINALLSGSQVSNPFAVPGAASTAGAAPAPIFGAAQAQYGANADAYNGQIASNNATTSGIASLAGIAAMAF